MSTGVSLAVIAGGLFAVVLAWIAVTRRPRRPSDSEPIVVWRRAQGYTIAHAFRVAELDIDALDAEPVAHCGRWAAGELVIDDDASRCGPCERAVERMEHCRQ